MKWPGKRPPVVVRLIEAKIIYADGQEWPIVLRVEDPGAGKSLTIKGHDRPVDLPPGASLEFPWPPEVSP